MPMLAELKRQFFANNKIDAASIMSAHSVRESHEETLIADQRGGLSPTQFVEQKLRSALNSGQSAATPSGSMQLPKTT